VIFLAPQRLQLRLRRQLRRVPCPDRVQLPGAASGRQPVAAGAVAAGAAAAGRLAPGRGPAGSRALSWPLRCGGAAWRLPRACRKERRTLWFPGARLALAFLLRSRSALGRWPWRGRTFRRGPPSPLRAVTSGFLLRAARSAPCPPCYASGTRSETGRDAHGGQERAAQLSAGVHGTGVHAAGDRGHQADWRWPATAPNYRKRQGRRQ
jgi:hypothetical protein